METIGFLTPYKHLPAFTKYVEKKYICKSITIHSSLENIDYIFIAPNYGITIDESFIKGSKVKKVLSPSTGTNHIDIKTVPVISIKNDWVLNTITSTAEHNLYLCLAIMRQIGTIEELSTKTLGILGFGRLGKMLYFMAKPIFKRVLHSDMNYTDEGFFSKTDFLSINIDNSKQNEKYINKQFVNRFKKPIFIINTARGEVVNESDLAECIKQKTVLGYATDVIQEEYTDTPTYLKQTSDPRILVTPHIGGTAIQAQEKAYKATIQKV